MSSLRKGSSDNFLLIALLKDSGLLSTKKAKSLMSSGFGSNSCFGKITGRPEAAASNAGIAKPPYFIGNAKISAAA